MRKTAHLDALDHPRRRKSKAPVVVLLLLILIAAPPLVEAARLHLASAGLFGLTGRVDTPILDALGALYQNSHSEVRDWISPMMVNRRWSPEVVLPIAFFWFVVAAMMLRRGH